MSAASSTISITTWQTDFAPIGMVSFNPQLLVARKAFPADDLKSLVAWMKAHPGDAKLVNQNAGGQIGGLLLEQKHRYQIAARALSRRRLPASPT